MAVKKEVLALGAARRDVNQKKRFSAPLEDQSERQVQTKIVVPENCKDRRTEPAHGFERLQIAKISEVPDFIGFSEHGNRSGRKSSMGVSNDRDAHGGNVSVRRGSSTGGMRAGGDGWQHAECSQLKGRTSAIDRSPRRRHNHSALKNPLLILAAILTGAVLANAQTAPAEVSRELKLAIQAALVDFDSKNYDAALIKLEAVDSKMPDDPFVQNLLGAAYTKKKDYAVAKKYFDKALAKQPDFFPAKFNVGELFFLQRQYAEALVYFQKMQEADPRNELLQFKIFLCHLQLGDKEAAAKALKGIKYPGDTPAWYYGQAAWESKNGNNKKALEYITGAQYIFGPKTALFDETFQDLGIKLR